MLGLVYGRGYFSVNCGMPHMVLSIVSITMNGKIGDAVRTRATTLNRTCMTEITLDGSTTSQLINQATRSKPMAGV
jgi:hypothetical protein